MKTIFLIGFMGSGKSTVGKSLSETYHLSFIDTDAYIEEAYDQKISEIFKVYGENVFRTYEQEAIERAVTYDVVSTGGGIVERETNIKTMKNNGKIVFLQTSFTHIEERLKQDVNRPLWHLNDRTAQISLYERRNRLYMQYADVIIHTDDKSVEEIVQEIGNNFSLSGR